VNTNKNKEIKLEITHLFSTGIVCCLWTTQLFTYLVTNNAIPLLCICEAIDLPHFGVRIPENAAYDAEI